MNKYKSGILYSSCFLMLFLYSATTVHGQETWTMDQFLQNYHESPSLKYQEKKVALKESLNQSQSIIERMEFRTETKDMELAKQEYSFRLSTRSINEITTNNSIQNKELALIQIHKNLLEENAIISRYNIIISLHFLRKKLDLLQQQISLLEQKKEALSITLSWEYRTMKELIKTEENLLSKDIEQFKTSNDIHRLELSINDLCQKEVFLNTDELIAARFIKKHYLKILRNDSINHTQLQELHLDLEKNALKKKELQVKNNKLVKFYQIKYNGSDKEFEQKQVSLGLGLLIPMPKNNKIRQAQLELEALEIQSDLASEVSSIKTNQYKILNQLSNDIKEYDLLLHHFENSISFKTSKVYQNIPDISVLTQLSLKEQELDLKETLLKTEFELFKHYIASLEAFHLVRTDPFQNYLSISHFGY